MSLLKVLTFSAGPLLDFKLAVNKWRLHVSGYVALNNEEKEHNVPGVLLVIGHGGKSYGPLRRCLSVPARAHAQLDARAPPVNQTYSETTLAAAHMELRTFPSCAMQTEPTEEPQQSNFLVPSDSEGMFAYIE